MSDGTWSLQRRVNRSIVGVLGLIAVLAAVVVVALVDVKSKGDEVVSRWDPALLERQRTIASVLSQETAFRGYTQTGEEEFLEPYESATEPLGQSLAVLEGYVDGESRLEALLRDYEGAIEAWQSEVAEPLIARTRQGDATAATEAVSDGAKSAFDRVRETGRLLRDSLTVRAQEARDARNRAFFYVWVSVGLGVLLIVVTGALLGRGLRRSVLAPVNALVLASRRVAGGDLDRAIHPQGPQELRQLGQDLDLMRAGLARELARVEQARQVLERRSAELARSNDDLEQFAYVASHDLSEPLRKVTNFCQLLERQYADQLDDRARMYIDYVVDGAKRMQVLISDLLSFSRVGRTTEHFEMVELDAVMARVRRNLEETVAASGATVSHDPLPAVPGDPTLLAALFENLVGNGLKYRDPARTPQVHIGVERRGDDWAFTIDDNGIGIDPQYAERIFTIFQRLHVRDKYGGTGIGLALCRKIADFHQGRLVLGRQDDGEPGARFELTLPVHHTPTQPEDVEDHEPAQHHHGRQPAVDPARRGRPR